MQTINISDETHAQLKADSEDPEYGFTIYKFADKAIKDALEARRERLKKLEKMK